MIVKHTQISNVYFLKPRVQILLPSVELTSACRGTVPEKWGSVISIAKEVLCHWQKSCVVYSDLFSIKASTKAHRLLISRSQVCSTRSFDFEYPFRFYAINHIKSHMHWPDHGILVFLRWPPGCANKSFTGTYNNACSHRKSKLLKEIFEFAWDKILLVATGRFYGWIDSINYYNKSRILPLLARPD